MNRRRVVRVPASSANLGPGYDTLAAALDVQLELEVEETGEFHVYTDVDGIVRDRTNLCVQAFEALHPADHVTFRIRSEIPVSAGLGSSSAAIVAGLVAADHMYEMDADVFGNAALLEGHPDNVAAALCGGFVISSGHEFHRFDPAPGLEGVLAVPSAPVATADARRLIPAEIPLEDAVHNISRVALLVLGLSRGDLDLVGRGLADRIHQPRRESIYPRSMELLRMAPLLGAVGATISGAGPSVLYWCHWEHTGGIVDRLRHEAPDCQVRRVQFTPQGADVRAIQAR